MRQTPNHISRLGKDEYIVVGTNKQGNHVGGAAKYAMTQFGLIWGCGEGLSGQTYALPTMEGLDSLKDAVSRFLLFARFNPDKTFLVTRVACGIAGYKDKEIAPLFASAPSNCVLPEGWRA